MDIDDLKKLARHAKQVRDAAVASAEADYRATIEALERVAGLADSHNKRVSPKKQGKTDNSRLSRGRLSDAIRASLQKLPQQFTIRDVERAIKQSDPALAQEAGMNSMSSALRRLSADESLKIEVVEAGQGKRPTIYRRKAG